MRRLILISFFSLTISGIYAQDMLVSASENSILNSTSFKQLQENTILEVSSIINDASIQHYQKLGSVSTSILQSYLTESNTSKITIIVSQLQTLLNTEHTSTEFKSIEFMGAQKTSCDGEEKIEIIRNNTLKMNSFVTNYLKRFYK